MMWRGCRANDTLNVRAGPSTSFGVIAKLNPTDTGIEVVDINDDGDWGLIILQEGSGWVALRYLARQPNQHDDGLPRYLNCAGTEPFWGFALGLDRKAKFTRLDETIPFDNVLAVPSDNRPDRHALFADGGEVVITAMVGRNQCSRRDVRPDLRAWDRPAGHGPDAGQGLFRLLFGGALRLTTISVPLVHHTQRQVDPTALR